MTDKTTNEELEAESVAVLPDREMMSLISTDPSDSLTTFGGPDKGPMPLEQTGPDPAPHVQPPPGDQMDAPSGDGVSSEPQSSTTTQTDSASASS